MHRPARCRDREWTGGVDDPQQDRHTGKIAIRSEFLSSLSAPVTLAELLTEPQGRFQPASVIAAIEWGAGYVRLRDLGRYVPDVEARSRELGGGGSAVAAALDAVGQ